MVTSNHSTYTIPNLLRLIADELEKNGGAEVSERTSQVVRSLLPDNKPKIRIEIRKDCKWKVLLTILAMIDADWFVMVDEDGNEIIKKGRVTRKSEVAINRKKVGEWFSKKFFGKAFSSWDQMKEFIFNNKKEEDLLGVMDHLKEMIKRRFEKNC